MSTEREYEAGTELDPEAAAYAENEASEEAAPPAKKERVREPDFDPSVQKQETAPDPDEERAARMGWAPKEQWRGPPDKWVDAKTFVERANPAILLERMDKMAREFDENSKRMERMNARALERQQAEFQQQIEDMRRQRDEAVMQKAQNGDIAGARQLAQQWDNHINQTVAANTSNDPPDTEAATQSWMRSRPEFATNRRFAAAATAELDQVIKDLGNRPGVTYADFYAELDKRLSEDFPQVYQKQQQKPTANGAPPPDMRQMDGVRISAKKTTNYASRLPAAARAQGERFVKQGAFKDLESYAKDFFNDE